jgi:hypothetical protein
MGEKGGAVQISRKRIREMRRVLTRQQERLLKLTNEARSLPKSQNLLASLNYEALQLGLAIRELARMETGELR